MVKVIRKRDIIAKQQEQIGPTSMEPVLRTFALRRTRSEIVTDPIEPIKKKIVIKMDALGNPDVNSVLDLGMAFDHRVTWFEFNLDDLLWNTEAKLGDDYINDESRYNHYLFKLAFKNVKTEEVQIYEFDGRRFYIPRGVTAPLSSQTTLPITEKIDYQIILIIQELQMDDMDYGNVSDKIETFVSKEWRGSVRPSSYTPGVLVEEEITKTFQLHSLTKPPVVCKLSDIGMFGVDRTVLGNNQDDTISYFKFGAPNTTGHLEGFNVFMRFEKDNKVLYRQWEETTSSEGGFDNNPDDHVERNPHILWIPTEVTQTPGDWKITIIAYCGNFDEFERADGGEEGIQDEGYQHTSLNEIVEEQTQKDGADENSTIDNNEDYYFYVSTDLVVKIEDNFLTQEDFEDKIHTSGYSNLKTEDGFIFATADNQILFGDEQ